jgi:hypothetical protein
MKTKTPQPANPLRLNDAFRLDSATANGSPIPVWDDGYGPLWTVWDNCGAWGYPIGVVRAQSWEDAYQCATDEIFPGPDSDSLAEFEAEVHKAIDAGEEFPELPEGWNYRGSGTPANGRAFPNVDTLYAVQSLDISNPVRRLTACNLDLESMDGARIALNFSL